MNERNVTIVAVSVLVVVALLGGGVIWWLHSELADKTKTRDDLQKKVKEATDKKNQLESLEATSAALTQKITDLEKRIPVLDESEYDDLADLIDNLRRLSNVYISEAKYDPKGKGGPATPPSMYRASYDFRLTGGFFYLLRFMNLLEAERRFVAVQHFNIAKQAEEEAGPVPVRSMDLVVYTFTRKPIEAPTSPGQPAPPVQPVAPTEASKSTPIPN